MALNPPQPSSPESPTRRPIILQYTRRRHRSGCPIPPPPPPPQNDTAPPPKKSKTTRDLPNLSECHACGFRIDINKVTHKTNRLELLYSEWRVVLLCKNCYNKVQKCGVCSYCFSGFDKADGFYLCNGCGRKVHKGCYSDSRDVSPWSYCRSGLGDGGFVCVDCWVPKNMASVSRCNKNHSRKSKEKGNDSGGGGGGLVGRLEKTSLEEVVKDVNRVAEKNVEVAGKKAGVAQRTVELASNVLELVAERDEDGGEGYNDDAELALQLHRAMNSSRRISRNSCSLSSSDLALPSVWKHNGDVSVSGDSCGKIKLCGNNEECENAEKDAPLGPSVRASDHDSSTDEESLKKESMMDAIPGLNNTNVCLTISDGEEENMEVPSKEGDKSCSNKLIISGGDDNHVDVEPYGKQDESMQNHNTGDGRPDRFLLRYTKRKSNLNSSSCDKQKPLYNGVLGKFGSSADAECLNSSDESRMLSGALCDTCDISSKASNCACGSWQDKL